LKANPNSGPPNPEEIKVFIANRDSSCEECGSELGHSAWIHLVEGKGALCLSCADLDHLEFLPSGDPALTRRAKQASALWAVVLKWSRARKRYERQGLLVEQKAIEDAEAACLEDEELRAARAQRRAAREELIDREYITQFAKALRQRYPSCPAGREQTIAEHACRKYSGRIGRSAQAKAFDPQSIDLAIRAHVRHTETDYDRLLAQGMDRHRSRQLVSGAVDAVLANWAQP
jgi:hypothetical protein